jgi:8-oxo-dGTP pyrophosphatase MutT (NUDIX family)
VICRRGDAILTVRATDPVTRETFLFLPGGAIEAGETPAVAAVRETLEETGYAIATVGEPVVLDYQYPWAGKLYDCRTFFFRAQVIDANALPMQVTDSFVESVEWVAVDDVEQVFVYHAEIRRIVKSMIL